MGSNLDLRRIISVWVLLAFLGNSLILPQAIAQDFLLPAPGVRVSLSPEFNPPLLKGIKVHPGNPLRLDFILDTADDASLPTKQSLKQESADLIKYFLASLTIPEKDMWVNLSPYEKERIVPELFGQTRMGRDLLAEDYLLKQITASLIYPQGETGKKFWKNVFEQSMKRFGTTNIPVSTFNKVWIVPQKATVYENPKVGSAFIIASKLKVMLEQDYLALSKNQRQPGDMFPRRSGSTCPQAGCRASNPLNPQAPQGNHLLTSEATNELASQIVRQIIIPELTREVNEGNNFTNF